MVLTTIATVPLRGTAASARLAEALQSEESTRDEPAGNLEGTHQHAAHLASAGCSVYPSRQSIRLPRAFQETGGG